MKRTTYILIGIFFSGLLLIIVSVIALSILSKKSIVDNLTFDRHQTEMDLNGVRVVKVWVNEGDENERIKNAYVVGQMTVTHVSTTGKEHLLYSKSKYMNVVQRNDTLFVEFDFKTDQISDKQWYDNSLLLKGFDMNLAVDTTLHSIITDLDQVTLKLKGLRSDSLFVRASQQDVLLDSCQFRSFDLDGWSFGFLAKNSKIENFYLNLDHAMNWTFENSEVGTEFLTGSNHCSNDLQKGECRRVVWTPQTEDAQLRITLREKSIIDVN